MKFNIATKHGKENGKKESVIIIGAGVAGLATGIYAQMNGFDTHIFEMHNKPGGACTGWKRKGYTFDYCIHNLPGSGAGSTDHHIWEELEAFNGSDVIDEEEFVSVEGHGKVLDLLRDVDRLEEQLKALAPNDAEAIEAYVGAVRKLRNFDIGSLSEGGLRSTLASLPYLRTVMRWSKVTMAAYAEEFTDPFLRKAFPLLHYAIPIVPVIANASTMASLGRGDMGRPACGSLQFARNLESKYQKVGGRVTYGARVEKIIVENDRAVGVLLDDGTEHRSDAVVSAADGHTTIYRMLEGKYTDELIRSYYEEWVPDTEPFALEVFIGTAMDLMGEKHSIVLMLDRPVEIAGRMHDHLSLEVFGHDTGFAPRGKGVIKVNFETGYEKWKDLREEGAYDREKELIASQVIEALSQRFPGLEDKVEAVDVVTPLTAERYTGTHRGFQCWPPKRSYMRIMRKGLSNTLPGLANFHMVGQWASANTGVTTAAKGARALVSKLCEERGRTFTAVPGEPRPKSAVVVKG